MAMAEIKELAVLEKTLRKEYEKKLAELDAWFSRKLNSIHEVCELLQDGEGRNTAQKVASSPADEAKLTEASLIDAVELAVFSQPGRKWRAEDIHNYLSEHDYPFGAKSPEVRRTSINVSLKRLQERGRVAVVRKGRGRRPGLYRAQITGRTGA